MPARLTMDQDYERRLLRQIVIQNENTMPCVSAGAGAPAPPCPVELVGWGRWGLCSAAGLCPLRTEVPNR